MVVGEWKPGIVGIGRSTFVTPIKDDLTTKISSYLDVG